MPIIFLSPSTQENNMYVTGTGSEEYWMNRLADAMIPYLNSCGIRYKRNTPDMTAGSSIRQANQGWYDFTWPSTPTPPRRATTATSGGSSPSTTPPAPRASGRPRSSSTTSGASIPCPTG